MKLNHSIYLCLYVYIPMEYFVKTSSELQDMSESQVIISMTSNTWLDNIKEYFLQPKTNCVETFSGTKFEYSTSVSFSSLSLNKWLQKEDLCAVFQKE